MNFKPELGDIVHYEGMGKTYAAIIVEVKEEGIVALCVFKESATQMIPVCYYSEHPTPGCWTPKAIVHKFSMEIPKDFGSNKPEEVKTKSKKKK